MRNPLRKAGIWLALGLTGVVGVLLAVYRYDELGAVVATTVGLVGINLLPFSLVMGLMSGLAAIGYARLLAGIGVIARWHLTPAEWDRFRAFDALRAAEDGALVGELLIREHTPERGIDVIVGRRQIIIDGSYHQLRRSGLPELRAVGWVRAPDDLECLEFTLVYPKGRFGGFRYHVLRVPVAPSAREAGVSVYWHFHASVPQGKPGIAFRRPGLVIGCCLAVTLAAALAGGFGWFRYSRSDQSDATQILMVAGTMTALGALFVTVLVALIVKPWKR